MLHTVLLTASSPSAGHVFARCMGVVGFILTITGAMGYGASRQMSDTALDNDGETL